MAVRPLFFVQKHDATRLHYDFRLEHDGVLWSWAVPKGPSLDPKDKRLAMHVEDHSREYATFAGRIPAGQYGAGVLEVWDHGTWVPLGDATADLAEGEMKFELDGTRLHGRFVLVRLKQRPKERAENGLLIKEHDAHEQPGTDVAAMEATHTPALSPQREKKKTKLPRTQRPQLATLVEQPSEAGSWMSEIKFDGYRLLAFKDGASVRLITRNGLDWTHRLPSLARIIAQMSLNTALLDGELVALRPDGVSSFPELQSALGDGRDDKLVFYVFDLLHHDGRDLLAPDPLQARKAALRRAGRALGRLDDGANLVPRLRRNDGRRGARPLRHRRVQVDPARSYPDRLAPQRPRLHRRRVVLATRTARRHSPSPQSLPASPCRSTTHWTGSPPPNPYLSEGTPTLMAERPIWRGQLRLALVSCPIALHAARHDSAKLHFNPDTGNRVRTITQDVETGVELQRRDLARGYEYEKDRYVVLDDEDFESARIDSSGTLEVDKFVPADSIDPVYYDASYYVTPDGDAGLEVYVVLRDAIAQAGRVALSRVVIARRERAVAIMPMLNGLVLHTLHDEHDIHNPKSLFEHVPA